ncbi:MAG: glycosyltransferase family 4 protein [Actinomycetota bacterium]
MDDPPPGHLVVVAHARGMGGSSRSLLSLLEHLPRDLTRTFVGPAAGAVHRAIRAGELTDREIELDWRASATPLRAIAAGVRVRRGPGVGAIHANGTADLLLALPAGVLARAPIVVWVHDEAVKRWARRLRRLVRLAPVEVRWATVSPSSIEMVAEAGLARRDEIELVPNPIDPVTVVADRIDERPGPRRIAFLGNSTDRKGFDLLPDIVERLADLDVTLVVYCRETERDDDRMVAVWRRLEGLGTAVEVAGRVAEPRDALGSADVVLVPSRSESFGRVIAEAQLNGLPVVASDLAPFRWLVEDGVDGVLFPVGDVDAAAEGVRRALSDELRRSARTAGPASAARFGPERVTAQLLGLYGMERRAD